MKTYRVLVPIESVGGHQIIQFMAKDADAALRIARSSRLADVGEVVDQSLEILSLDFGAVGPRHLSEVPHRS